MDIFASAFNVSPLSLLLRHTHLFVFLSFITISTGANAEVEELTNMEMTEAYIEDGTIVVKQRNRQPVKQAAEEDKPKVRLRINVGPGEAEVSEADIVREQSQTNTYQSASIDAELNNDLTIEQLQQSELATINDQAPSIEINSPAVLAREAQVHDHVRNELGLDANTQITNAHIVSYMEQQNGTWGNNVTGMQQELTPSGFQISIPNLGNYQPGVHPSGDGNISVQVTDQHIIWNFIYPQN